MIPNKIEKDRDRESGARKCSRI